MLTEEFKQIGADAVFSETSRLDVINADCSKVTIRATGEHFDMSGLFSLENVQLVACVARFPMMGATTANERQERVVWKCVFADRVVFLSGVAKGAADLSDDENKAAYTYFDGKAYETKPNAQLFVADLLQSKSRIKAIRETVSSIEGFKIIAEQLIDGLGRDAAVEIHKTLANRLGFVAGSLTTL